VFSGLVDSVGSLDRVAETEAGREFRILCGYDDLTDGESIAVNGACLTVRAHGPGWFTVAAVSTTMGRTTLAGWQVGRRVNLERALRLGDRLGGHLVLGHVDGVGRVQNVAQRGDARLVDLALPVEVAELLVPQGSLTVDGVSLTVNALPVGETAQISLIEYTLRHTTLGALREADEVHVEADVIGKYIQRLTASYRTQAI